MTKLVVDLEQMALNELVGEHARRFVVRCLDNLLDFNEAEAELLCLADKSQERCGI